MVFKKIQKLQLDDTSKKIWGNFFLLEVYKLQTFASRKFSEEKKREIHDRNFREF